MFKSLRLAIFGLVLVVGFQNCSASKFSGSDNQQQNKTSGSNGGFDGKAFVHTGGCPGNPTAVDSRIQISNDLTTVNLLRTDCQDLPAPYANIAKNFDLTGYTHQVVYNRDSDKIYDLEVASGTQIGTKVICEANSGATNPFLKISAPVGTSSYSGELDLANQAPINFYVGVKVNLGTSTTYVDGYCSSGGSPTSSSLPTFNLAIGVQPYLTYSDDGASQNLDVFCYEDESLGSASPTPAVNGGPQSGPKYYSMGGK